MPEVQVFEPGQGAGLSQEREVGVGVGGRAAAAEMAAEAVLQDVTQFSL